MYFFLSQELPVFIKQFQFYSTSNRSFVMLISITLKDKVR